MPVQFWGLFHAQTCPDSVRLLVLLIKTSDEWMAGVNRERATSHPSIPASFRRSPGQRRSEDDFKEVCSLALGRIFLCDLFSDPFT